MTVGGTLTHWSSKTQPTVSQSSCEAEYRSASLCASEMMFTQYLLDEITQCHNPAILYEDNTAAIFLINNQHVGARTKHIDIKYHFIRELTESGQIKIQFIRSEDNVADGNTKNLSEVIFTKHRNKLRSGRLEYTWEDVEGSRVERVPETSFHSSLKNESSYNHINYNNLLNDDRNDVEIIDDEKMWTEVKSRKRRKRVPIGTRSRRTPASRVTKQDSRKHRNLWGQGKFHSSKRKGSDG